MAYIIPSVNVYAQHDVRLTERDSAEPRGTEPSAFEVEMDIENIKRHTSPGTDQIPTELIESGTRTFSSEFHCLINSIWNE